MQEENYTVDLTLSWAGRASNLSIPSAVNPTRPCLSQANVQMPRGDTAPGWGGGWGDTSLYFEKDRLILTTTTHALWIMLTHAQ